VAGMEKKSKNRLQWSSLSGRDFRFMHVIVSKKFHFNI
jgi:hypothetical protein